MTSQWDMSDLGSIAGQTKSLSKLSLQIDSLYQRPLNIATSLPTDNGFAMWIQQYQEVKMQLAEIQGYCECVSGVDVRNPEIGALHEGLNKQLVRVAGLQNRLQGWLAALSDETFDGLLNDTKLKDLSFVLHELRQCADKRTTDAQEALMEELSEDGYRGWAQFYHAIVRETTFMMRTEARESESLSFGQMLGRMNHQDKVVRETAFLAWKAGWEANADLCAQALNHFAGFRLKAYERRGWESPMHEALLQNRISESTLETMGGPLAVIVTRSSAIWN